VESASEIDYGAADVWERLAETDRRSPAEAVRQAGWNRCEPEWRWQHRLPDFDVWAVTKGTGHARLGDIEVTVRAGTLLMLRPGDVIDATHDPSDPLQVGNVHYHYRDEPPPDLLPPRIMQLTEPALIADRLRVIIAAAHRRDGSGLPQASAELRAMIMEIHVQAARSVNALLPPLDPRIRIAINTVHNRLAERPTLAEMATAARLAPDTFSRLFRSETGRTFREYCVAARVERARELLTESGLNIAEVARALGYTDYRLFARQFAQLNGGRPPSRWRGSVRTEPVAPTSGSVPQDHGSRRRG